MAHPKNSTGKPWHRPGLATATGYFLLAYFAFLLVFRSSLRGLAGAYDVIWACNVALVVAGIGMLYKNAAIVASGVGLISMAHFLWMVDVAMYPLMGSFPVGVASYLIWPQTSWLEIVSTLHHVWFIPLCFAVLYKNGRLDLVAWGYTLVFSFTLLFISYAITPKTHDGVYLNINMAHEIWKDLSTDSLNHWNPPQRAWIVYALVVYSITTVINTTIYLFWRQLHYVFWPDHHEVDAKKVR